MKLPPKLWEGVLRRLGAEMPAFALEAWVRPLVARGDGPGLRLLCPTAFHRDRVRERHLALIERCAAAEVGAAVRVSLELAPAAAREPAAGEPRAAAAPPAVREPRAPAAAPREPRGPAQRAFPYRFDNFVVGPCNALAREAALAMARHGQPGLDLLYLSSDPGLGKTHLAQSIVEEAQRSRRSRVLYGSAEAFTNRFTAALRSRRMDRFKQRFRERCDLLVVEDVQFLGSKAATQLELFHTIAHLLDAGARVVLTGDRLPRRIGGLDARLSSQMSAGLVAELEPPDAAVRREILSAKAARGGVRLPEACLDLLVEGVRGSVRDLEGVLIQLVASASLLERPIDLDLTRAALRKVAEPAAERRRLELRVVIEAVAAFFGTSPEALASRSRRRDVLVPRQLAMYLCHRYTDEPLSSIARAFGREHPAVSNAIKAVERGILERAPLRYRVEALSARLAELERSDDRPGVRVESRGEVERRPPARPHRDPGARL